MNEFLRGVGFPQVVDTDHVCNNENQDIMPVREICVYPSDHKQDEDSTAEQLECKAMLQSMVSTCPSANNGSSPLSSPSSAQDICRICHCEAESNAPLIAPCLCSGSLRYVHQECLQQWIKSSDTKKCELCKFEFIMQTKIKPFRNWEKLEMSAVERRKVFCSVTFHVVAITCVVWSLYVLIDRTAEEVKAGQLEWPFWTKLIVVAIGFTGGLVFMYVQCKMYMQLCRRWKAFNRIIYVQNAPPKAVIVNMNSSSPIQNFGTEASLPMTSAKVETCAITSNIVETHTLNTVAPAVAAAPPKLTFPLPSPPLQSPSMPVTVPAPSPPSANATFSFNNSDVFSGNNNNNNNNHTYNNNNSNSDVNTRISEDVTVSALTFNSGLQVVQRIS